DASDMSAFNGSLQNKDTIQVNNDYSIIYDEDAQTTGTLFIQRPNYVSNLSIVGSPDVTTPTISWDASSTEKFNFIEASSSSQTQPLNLTLGNLVFEDGNYIRGGFANIEVFGPSTITGNNIEINNCSALSQGGAFYFVNNATFTGDNSSMTFTNNKAGVGADSRPNDIYCAYNLLFTGSGTYTLNGGIETGASGSLNIGSTENSNAPTIIFGSGAVNALNNLNINGVETKATFANGSTTQVGGKTTIENVGTAANGDSVESNIQFAGTEEFVKDVDIINSNVDFSGKETFSNVTVSNGSDVNFSGENSASGTVLIKDTATKAHFDGAQHLSQLQITNHAVADSSASVNNAYTNTKITVDDFGEFNINSVFNSDSDSSLTVNNKGVVNLLWADESDVTDFDFNGNLTVGNGGTVTLNNPYGNLNISGTLNGEAGGALNAAIMNSALDANSDAAANSELLEAVGNTITVDTLRSSGAYINVLTSGFGYHDETKTFAFIILSDENTDGISLGDFLKSVSLPFSWFGTIDENDYTFINQNTSAIGKTLYIFKVDGDKVPEPSTWALMILGVAGLYFVRRKNSAK
ncbi:MAG: PEP-CTERM sorting domain-containing protein, partial [Thermoguttaceae bacterium]|nr:PEP-CTERM sorting domain-containing protein [Thermoguttaceae bacterium]